MSLSLRWWALWGAFLGLPMIVLVAMIESPGIDKLWMANSFHFYVVSGTALAAAAACILVMSLTDSLRETRLVFLGLAFLSIAAIFSVHGLGTPGHIHATYYTQVGFSSWFSVFIGATFIAISASTLPTALEDWLKRYGVLIFAGVTLLAGLYIGMSIGVDDWLDWVPISNRNLQYGATAATMVMLSIGVWRYFQAFLFARLLSQWAMVIALVLLMEVQVAITWGRVWHYSWWMYHGTYAVAFVVLFAGWLIEARRAGSLRVIADALSMRDAIAQLGHGYSQPIADLVDAIEWKDLYTLGHVRRVASYAVITGKELGLSTLELRSLALGAQMHDVGKIGVPDKILMKPGFLTPEEYLEIKEHVARGSEIAMRTPALRSVTEAIRHHHERMDGTGYPDGLKGEEIPLHARIVCVADSFDAMTSGRVYQPAVSREAGLAELRRHAGSQFDARVVEAFAVALSKTRDERVGEPLVVAAAQAEVAA